MGPSTCFGKQTLFFTYVFFEEVLVLVILEFGVDYMIEDLAQRYFVRVTSNDAAEFGPGDEGDVAV